MALVKTLEYDIILYIKHLFLTFAQECFKVYTPIPWDYDITRTQIMIMDKTSIDIGKVTSRPAIVLSRGDTGWAYYVRGQDANNAVLTVSNNSYKNLNGVPEDVGYFQTETFSDLLRSAVSFNIIAKSGLQAEQIANHLFINLTGFRAEFRKKGILQFNMMSISPEQLIKVNSEVQMVGVTINIGFMMQHTITRQNNYYNINIYADNYLLKENADYKVIENGTQIHFLTTSYMNKNLIVDYRDAITLENKLNMGLIPTDKSCIFDLEDFGKILGYYNVLNNLNPVVN